MKSKKGGQYILYNDKSMLYENCRQKITENCINSSEIQIKLKSHQIDYGDKRKIFSYRSRMNNFNYNFLGQTMTENANVWTVEQMSIN